MDIKNHFILFIITITLASCINIDEGKSGISDSISESNEKGVFVMEKLLTKNINKDNLGENIEVKNFWFEYMWTKGDSPDEVRIDTTFYQFSATLNCQLPQNIKDSLLVIYNDNMKIKLGLFNSRIYSYAHLRKLELPDSVVLDFYLKEKSNERKIKTVVLK